METAAVLDIDIQRKKRQRQKQTRRYGAHSAMFDPDPSPWLISQQLHPIRL